MTPEQKAYEAGYEAARKQAAKECEKVANGYLKYLGGGDSRKCQQERLACSHCHDAIATMTPEKADD